MTGGVDRFYAGQAEVPEKVRLGEGCKEGAARPVDVDGNIEPGLGLKTIEGKTNFVDRLELKGERNAQSDDNADGIFVAALEDLFRREEETVAFHGDLADF